MLTESLVSNTVGFIEVLRKLHKAGIIDEDNLYSLSKMKVDLLKRYIGELTDQELKDRCEAVISAQLEYQILRI